MGQEFVFTGRPERAQAQKPGMVAQAPRQTGLGDSLFGPAAKARHAQQRFLCAAAGLIQFLGNQFQHRSQQPDLGLANLKLRRVNPGGQSACSRRHVISHQSALPPLIQFPRAG